MLYSRPKNEAIAIHEKAVAKYNTAYEQIQKKGSQLYEERQDSLALIHEIEMLVSSISNSPKEFSSKLADIRAEREKFRQTEEYAKESMDAAIQSGAGVAAGVMGGAAVASMAPTAAMWVATTFGTASTGAAISSLSGAAAAKAALAWLGGGALSAGGAGVAGGQALLALAGPIGWGIAGVTTATSIFMLGHKNKKVADEAIAEAKKITIAGAELHEATAKIQDLIDRTKPLLRRLRESFEANSVFRNANYVEIAEDDQYRLGAMVNSTRSLAQLLNETV